MRPVSGLDEGAAGGIGAAVEAACSPAAFISLAAGLKGVSYADTAAAVSFNATGVLAAAEPTGSDLMAGLIPVASAVLACAGVFTTGIDAGGDFLMPSSCESPGLVNPTLCSILPFPPDSST